MFSLHVHRHFMNIFQCYSSLAFKLQFLVLGFPMRRGTGQDPRLAIVI